MGEKMKRTATNDCTKSEDSATIYRPHNKIKSPVPCTVWDLVLVSEGVQCSKCLALVTEHNPSPSPLTQEEKIERLTSYGFEFNNQKGGPS